MATYNIILNIILLSWINEIILVASQTDELRCQCSCTSMKNPEVIMYASGNLHQKGNLGLMDSLNVKTDAATKTRNKVTNVSNQMNSGGNSQGGGVYDTSAYAVNENNSVTLNLQMVNSNVKEQNVQEGGSKTTSNNKPPDNTKKGLTLRSLNELLKAATSQLLAVFSKQKSAEKSKKNLSNLTSFSDKSKPSQPQSEQQQERQPQQLLPQLPPQLPPRPQPQQQPQKRPKTLVTDTVISGSEGLSGILQPSLNRLGQSKDLQKTERTVKSEEVTNKTSISSTVVKGMQEVKVDTYTQLDKNTIAGSAGAGSEWITAKPEIYVHPQVQNIESPDNNIILPSLSQTITKNDLTHNKQENMAFQDMSVKKTDKIDIYIPSESAMSHLDKMLQTRTPVDFGSSANRLSDQTAGGSLSPLNPTTDNLGSVKTSSYIPTHLDVYNPLDDTGVMVKSSVPSAKINVGSLGLGPASKSNSNAASKSMESSTLELGASQYQSGLNVNPDATGNAYPDVYQPPVVGSTSGTATGNAQPDVYTSPVGGKRTDTSLNAQADVYTSHVRGSPVDTISANVNADLYVSNIGSKTTGPTATQPDIYVPVVGGKATGPTTAQPDIYIPIVRGNTPSVTPQPDIYIPVIGGSASGHATPAPDMYVPPSGVHALGMSLTDKQSQNPGLGDHIFGTLLGTSTGQMDSSSSAMSVTDKQTQDSGLGDHIFGTLLGTSPKQMDSSNTIPNGPTDPPLNVYEPPKVIGTSYIETSNTVSGTDTTLGDNLHVGLSSQDLSGQRSATGTQSDVYVPPSDTTLVKTDSSSSNSLNSFMDTTVKKTIDKATPYNDQIIPLWVTESTPSPVVGNSGSKTQPSWMTDTTASPTSIGPWNQVKDKTPPSWMVDTTASPTISPNNVGVHANEHSSWFLDTGSQSSLTDTTSNNKKTPPSWITDTTGNTQQNTGNSQLWTDSLNANSIHQQDQVGQSTIQIGTEPSTIKTKNQDVPSWLSDTSASKPNLNLIKSQQTTSGYVDQSGSAKHTSTLAEDWATLYNQQSLTTDQNTAQSSSSSSSSGNLNANSATQSKVTFENVDWNNLINQLKNDGQTAINSNLQSGDLSRQSKTISNNQQNAGKSITKANNNEVNMQELTSMFENYVKNVRSKTRSQNKPKPKPSTPAPNQMSQSEQFALAMMFGSMIN